MRTIHFPKLFCQISRKLSSDKKMGPGFLEVFPREIRDQIYTYILSSSSNAVTLAPWTIEVTRSMTILRTCKQIQKECKEIIWLYNGLRLRESTQLFTKFSVLMENPAWSARALETRLSQIHLPGRDKDKPGAGAVKEYEEELDLMCTGEYVDGRLFGGGPDALGTKLIYKTSWPHFSH
ncbi:hypothetical protein G7Y89_g9745 [Cudoniella acicularis]|uniref:F-box domain-containing protein n=1 Tax=Cudoniella acicularis TaxID=354080 RepID=A0A8H4RE31_9HELO|nr:hypothetical protein G7Y89_g9745 [Cudoniella acicularis]